VRTTVCLRRQLGKDVEKGLIPNDRELFGTMISNLCYHNARKYLNFGPGS